MSHSMNIFVYRDMFFQLTDRDYFWVLSSEQGHTIHTWEGRKLALLDIRQVADEYVDQRVMEANHAGGDVVCEICTKRFSRHPPFRGAFFMEHPYLTRLCDGKLVKL